MEGDLNCLQMEDDLNFFLQIKGDLIFLENGRQLQSLEDDLNIVANGRQYQYCRQWKTASIIWKMEDYLNYLENGRRPQLLVNWR